MSHQFIHYEKYTLDEIKNILNEAGREKGYTPHVTNPEPPQILMGSLEELEQKLTTEVPKTTYNVMTKSHGKDVIAKKKIRKDANVLLAGVASYPKKRTDPDYKDEDFLEWTSLLKKFLDKKYGKRLHTMILHLDESHPHIHFYVIPDNYEMNTLCPSDKAMKEKEIELKSNNDITPAQKSLLKKQAGKKALQEYQDDYFKSVSVYIGMARTGPKRRRLTRQQWKDETVANKLIGDCLLKQEKNNKKLRTKTTDSEKEIIRLKGIVEEQELMIGMMGLGTETPPQPKPEPKKDQFTWELANTLKADPDPSS